MVPAPSAEDVLRTKMRLLYNHVTAVEAVAICIRKQNDELTQNHKMRIRLASEMLYAMHAGQFPLEQARLTFVHPVRMFGSSSVGLGVDQCSTREFLFTVFGECDARAGSLPITISTTSSMIYLVCVALPECSKWKTLKCGL